MITWFRSLLSGPGKWIFLGLVVLAFAAFGNFELPSFTSNAALEVGDEGFTTAEIDRTFARSLQAARADNPTLTREDALQAGLLEQTLTELTARALIAAEADRLGLTATNEMVQRTLRESEAFIDPATGEFSAARLQIILQNNNILPSQFTDDLRADIVRQQLISALGTPARAPENFVRLLVLRAGEERSMRTAVITAAGGLEADEDALRSYYAANAEQYRSPELRTYRALIIDDAAVADDVEVSDADVMQLFESRRAQFGTPELRTFRQALFRDPVQAQAAADRVASGEQLRAIAEELGVSTTRSVGQTREAIPDPVVAEAIFSSDTTGLVGPIAGTFGTVVAQVEDITPGTETAFEDVEADLRETLRAELVRNAAFAALENVEAAFDEGATLAEAADAADLPAPRSFGPVDQNLFTPEGAIETAPGAAHRQAFILSEGEESESVPLDNGGFAYVIVDQVIPSATRPFEEVEERVAADYAAAERENALATAIDAFDARIAGGATFEEAATEVGSDVQTNTISAQRPNPDLPRALFVDAFSADIGETISAPTPAGDSAVVAIIDGVNFRADPNGEALFGGYRDQVGEQVASELLNTYLEALEADFGVRRDESAIAQQFGQAE